MGVELTLNKYILDKDYPADYVKCNFIYINNCLLMIIRKKTELTELKSIRTVTPKALLYLYQLLIWECQEKTKLFQ